MVQVIKEKHNLVRETVDKKKCVVVFGVIEKRNPVKFVRDREDMEIAKGVINKIQDENQELEKDTEEVFRIGKYVEGRHRPIKIKLKSQTTVEELLARSARLASKEETKDIWIKRDMTWKRERKKNYQELRPRKQMRREQRPRK